MYPRRTIYRAGRSRVPGEVKVSPGTAVKFFYHFARSFGAGLIAFAIVGFIFSFWPILQVELNYRFFGKSVSQEPTGNLPNSDAEALGLDPYFSIYIPKIDAKANVIPNVDAGNPVDYLAALKKGVAHAKGTNFPGQGKLIYLFSHSTDSPLDFARYNAIFYLLDQLKKGDVIIIYFMNQEYDYAVTNEYVTAANDTPWLKDDGSGEKLILQTCDPPGTSWHRLLVVAQPINP
jgi:LPXTG-site transpeptidase (sortase) family protein